MREADPKKPSTWHGTLMGMLWMVTHYTAPAKWRSLRRRAWTKPRPCYRALSVYRANPGFQAVPVLAGARRPERGAVAVENPDATETAYFGRILGPVFFGWPDLKDRANRELLKYEVMHFSRAPLEKQQPKDRLSAAEAEQLRDFLKAKDLL